MFYAVLTVSVVSLIPIFPSKSKVVAQNPFLFKDLVPLTPSILLMTIVTALMHIIAMTASIFDYQIAESTFVAPIEYTYLVLAAVIDFVIWAVLPSSKILIGVTLVVGSGILITLRELASRH